MGIFAADEINRLYGLMDSRRQRLAKVLGVSSDCSWEFLIEQVERVCTALESNRQHQLEEEKRHETKWGGVWKNFNKENE